MAMPDLISSPIPVTERMQQLIDQWQASNDRRAAFLACYHVMTANMLTAIDQGEFNDGEWVNNLLHHFAGYYFKALDEYEQSDPATPNVWRQTFDAASQPGTLILQNLLLGINAHINYDLIFALVDMLEPEWYQLSPDERQGRYDDHCQVNDVIRRSIDTVQDTIIEPGAPLLEFADRLFGSADEWVVSRLISHWREEVWRHAQHLLEAADLDERQRLKNEIEKEALERTHLILRV
jgi:Family of unknown function (DUF5995)